VPPVVLATFIVAWFIPPTINAAIIRIININSDVFIKLSEKRKNRGFQGEFTTANLYHPQIVR
jgi:hypothetical protein